jgi:periplasmic protein TonB
MNNVISAYDPLHPRAVNHVSVYCVARQRAMPMVAVVALHALLLAALTVSFKNDTLLVSPTTIQATVLAGSAPAESPLPVPTVTLERPRLDIDVPLPDVPQAMAASNNSIEVEMRPAAPSPAPEAPPEPVTPPRFDAAYLNNPAPTYPPTSRRLHEHGVVLLRVRVTPEGHPAEVLVERTSGSGRLDSAAINAVQQWKFVPARRGSEPAEAWVIVPLQFELRS